MGIRDILMTIMGWGCVPVAMYDAYYGLLAYYWLSLMKPQSFVWSSGVQSSRFVFFTAIFMFLRAAITPGPKFRPRGPAWWFIAFWIWMGFCAHFSPHRPMAMEFFEKFSKISIALMLMTGLVRTKKEFKTLLILFAMCPGVYAIRLGTFLLRGGGVTHHGGPLGMDNNDTALFIAMGIPMLTFMAYQVQGKWKKRGLLTTAVLAIPAVIAGGSRGGLLAMSTAVLITLWRRYSIKKAGIALALMIPLGLMIVPPETYERYMTIKTYEDDPSAMGRIWAWQVAKSMADARPLFGVGLGQGPFLREYHNYMIHELDQPHVAHSVWFSTLAGSGYVGLSFLVGMLLSVFWTCRKIRKRILRDYPIEGKNHWAWQDAAMIEATVLAFCVGASFLSQVGFEYIYAISLTPTILLWLIDDATQMETVAVKAAEETPKRKVRNVGLYPLPQ